MWRSSALRVSHIWRILMSTLYPISFSFPDSISHFLGCGVSVIPTLSSIIQCFSPNNPLQYISIYSKAHGIWVIYFIREIVIFLWESLITLQTRRSYLIFIAIYFTYFQELILAWVSTEFPYLLTATLDWCRGEYDLVRNAQNSYKHDTKNISDVWFYQFSKHMAEIDLQ